ncbi:MAG: hypothetical protein AB7V13_08360, partial [Pseudorhodoplanes sp.]
NLDTNSAVGFATIVSKTGKLDINYDSYHEADDSNAGGGGNEFELELWINGPCTISQASPAVITYPKHGLVADQKIGFTTSGALPTGLSAWPTKYWVKDVLGVDTFTVSATAGGAAINTSGAGSGNHFARARYGEPKKRVVNHNTNDYRGDVTFSRFHQVSPGVSHQVAIFVGGTTFSGSGKNHEAFEVYLKVLEHKHYVA